MKVFIFEYAAHFLVIHLGFAALGLYIKLINDRYLQVSSFIFSAIFGVLYFLAEVSDMRRVVIDLRNKK